MPRYLMEHPLEAERLELKTGKDKVLEELKNVPLRRGDRVLDVGCGTGAVTRILAERAAPGEVVGVDLSSERLAAAEKIARQKGIRNLRFVRADVRDLALGQRKFDLVYSRCLFQYLPGEAGMETLKGMKRLARREGRVCVSDVDGNILYRYPVDPKWEKTLEGFLREVEKLGFDPFVGRKLYWMFCQAGFRDIRVHIQPYYLIAGKADLVTRRVWEMKAQILAATLKDIFSSERTGRKMTDRFLKDFQRADGLLYNFLFLVHGRK
jgi:ubiquinone/menaquinone biosynthesis C-methylase UbiE